MFLEELIRACAEGSDAAAWEEFVYRECGLRLFTQNDKIARNPFLR